MADVDISTYAGLGLDFDAVDHEFDVVFGDQAGEVCEGDDPRLSDDRDPNAHASTHAPGQPDAIATGSTGVTVCIGNDARLSDARTPTAHAASHLPGGSDALTTAAAGTISPDDTAAAGSAASFARSDHRHAITCSAASANPPGTSSAEGSSGNFARADHAHALAAFGTGSGTFCEGNDARVVNAIDTAAVFRLMTLRVL